MARSVFSDPTHQWAVWVESRSDRLIVLLLLAAALLAYLLNLGHLPLRDWDEGLVAQVAREIAEAPPGSHTWLFPTLWDSPYYNKPPLVHNLVALAYQVGGVNEWTARLPGAVLSAASVPLLYGIGRDIFVRRLTALAGAAVYLAMLPVLRHGRLAMLDGAVLCFFLLLLLCLLRSRRNPNWALGVGVGFGLLCLSKGLIALLLGAIALAFVAADAPRLLTSFRHWLGLLIGSLPAIAWYAAQGIHYGQDFWMVHLFDQALDRINESVENNSGPPWFYLLELLKYGFPWLIFLPIAVRELWGDRNRSWAKLVVIWGIGYLGVISIMDTKLPWYVIPIYPALALAIAPELTRLWDELPGRSPKRAPSLRYRRVLGGFFALLAIGGWAGCTYFGGFEGKPVLAISLGALGLTMSAVTVLWVRRDRQCISVLIWGFYVSMLLFVSSDHWVWELGEDYPVKPVAEVIRSAAPPEESILTSHGLNRPSLNFYSQHQVIPANRRQLVQRWRNDETPYLLLDENSLTQKAFESAKQLGSAEGWTLITRDRQ
ncbi:MAG: glycosyltransferase family 39 protein [Elainellaceae cyanobacterium]